MQDERWVLVVTIVMGLALAACGGSHGEQAGPYTIGVLTFTASMDAVYEGFRAGLADLGYVEGERVTYIYEITANDADQLRAGARRLLAQDVDLIVSLATPSTLAAKAATRGNEVPVVFAPINDPVGSGIVRSLVDPGGNLTGVRIGGFVPKDLEWLLMMAGGDADLILAPYNPHDSSSTVGRKVLKAEADAQGVALLTPEVTTPAEIAAVLADVPAGVDGILMLPDAMIATQASLFAQTGIRLGIPTVGISSDAVKRGVLLGYGAEFYEAGYQAARLADQIFKGTQPADLPVETAEYVLSVNLVTAEASGIDISDGMLWQALSGVIVRPGSAMGVAADQ